MTELSIGKHCYVENCKQLDFLPIKCQWCEKEFCKVHKFPDDHQCEKHKLHVATGGVDMSGYACMVEGCEMRELTPVSCPSCTNNFCLKHRHQVDHKCPRLEQPDERMKQTREHIQQIIASRQPNSQRKPLGKKSKQTAAKVALMKMKMNASGEKKIPESERIYFLVSFPEESTTQPKPLFFSKKWTVGRVIDYASNIAGIRNTNNVPGQKKLCLFDSADGNYFSADKTLEDAAVAAVLPSGHSVILEYCVDSESEPT